MQKPLTPQRQSPLKFETITELLTTLNQNWRGCLIDGLLPTLMEEERIEAASPN
jgi:hypothetical protein